MRATVTYVGRFAPSPSGPLHAGSLLAAAASWLDARAHGGRWLVRIEDLDTPRCVAGSEAAILRTLDAYGMSPDAPVSYQGRRLHHYREAFNTLADAGHAYACGCTRADERAAAITPGVYPGTCRDGLKPGRAPRSVRLRLPDAVMRFTDRFAGPQRAHLTREIGDPIIRRADGLFAYVLAGAVDDAEQGITHVVRGDDLLPTTAAQRAVLQLLDRPVPVYGHVPVVRDASGRKLSKQHHAPPVDDDAPRPTLLAAFTALGLTDHDPQLHAIDDLDSLWAHATDAWRTSRGIELAQASEIMTPPS